MSKLSIITIPDPVLKAVASPVARVDDAVRKQMDDMLKAMYDAPGVGLAANQVGLLNRVIVMDCAAREGSDERKPICMANPEIVWASDDHSIMEEGCLSIPGQFAEIERPASVRVKYLGYDGREAELQTDEGSLLTHCLQHEIDHLNGVLFIDYLSKLKRDMIVKRVGKLKKSQDVL